MADATHFTLEEFGDDFRSFASLDVNGGWMVFQSFKDASEMAEWMLEGGPENRQLPLIGILAWTGDPSDDDRDEPESWSAGWTQYDSSNKVEVSTHEGDYENDPAIWKEEVS
jgi:hypothetical protein